MRDVEFRNSADARLALRGLEVPPVRPPDPWHAAHGEDFEPVPSRDRPRSYVEKVASASKLPSDQRIITW